MYPFFLNWLLPIQLMRVQSLYWSKRCEDACGRARDSRRQLQEEQESSFEHLFRASSLSARLLCLHQFHNMFRRLFDHKSALHERSQWRWFWSLLEEAVLWRNNWCGGFLLAESLMLLRDFRRAGSFRKFRRKILMYRFSTKQHQELSPVLSQLA